MDFLQRQREIDNTQLLYNIQELLKIISNQQAQMISLLAKSQGIKPTSSTAKTKKKAVSKK